MVFKKIVVHQFNVGAGCCKEMLSEPDIAVANVFRRQGQVDRTMDAVGHGPCQHIIENEKG